MDTLIDSAIVAVIVAEFGILPLLLCIGEPEGCPECGSKSFTPEFLPETPASLYGDSSYVPTFRKKCKSCGTVY